MNAVGRYYTFNVLYLFNLIEHNYRVSLINFGLRCYNITFYYRALFVEIDDSNTLKYFSSNTAYVHSKGTSLETAEK